MSKNAWPWAACLGTVLVLGLGGVAASAAEAGGAGVEALGGATAWRFCVVCRPVNVEPGRASKPVRGRWVRWGEPLEAPLPPADWTKPEFDDGGWPRRAGAVLGGYGFTRNGGAALVCVRGRFGVPDPAAAKGLRLALVYRGGAVVYVNGREVGRGHLPSGALDPLAPAEAYPREAFVTADGAAVLPDLGTRAPAADVADRYNARLRRLEVGLPADALRKGTNVLAVELHRAPIPADLPRGGAGNWDTVGLVSLRLTAADGGAVVPNVGPPGGTRVWAAPPLAGPGLGLEYPDPLEPVRPVDLHAPVNGLASGQVVVTAAAEGPGIRATVSDLRSAGGRTIPAAAVRVRYARPYEDRGFVALWDVPQESARVQAAWLTVRVPPDAEPGVYAGEATVEAPGGSAKVPVRLAVHGWRVPDPAAWRTCVNLLQSPESVAGHYGVPLWSDRHFALMERSFRLMGEGGNDVLGVLAVGKTVFGDDPLIIFRREGDGWVPEFRFLERYLGLYAKHAHPPKFLALHVWSYGMYQRGAGRDGGDREKMAETIPVAELRGADLVPVELPMYGKPGTEETWKAVMDGLKARLDGLGWKDTRVVLGTSGDGWPHESTIDLFRKVAPWARWRAITHGNGCPNWGPTDKDRTQPNGMVVGYLELVRRITSSRERLADHPVTCSARDCLGTDPFGYRSLPPCNVVSAGYDGFSWKGIDYWPYTRADGKKWSALNTYVHFGNIVGGTPRTLSAPGPDGAVATVQYEMLREGIQDAEAMWLIRDALADQARRARLGADLAARAEAAMDEMLAMLETGLRFSPSGGADVSWHVRRLYAVAAEVSKAVGEAR